MKGRKMPQKRRRHQRRGPQGELRALRTRHDANCRTRTLFFAARLRQFVDDHKLLENVAPNHPKDFIHGGLPFDSFFKPFTSDARKKTQDDDFASVSLPSGRFF